MKKKKKNIHFSYCFLGEEKTQKIVICFIILFFIPKSQLQNKNLVSNRGKYSKHQRIFHERLAFCFRFSRRLFPASTIGYTFSSGAMEHSMKTGPFMERAF